MKVVVNTSPLIVLDRLGLLHLLPQLFQRVTRPRAVLDEILAGQSLYGASDELLNASWMETLENPAEMALRKELGYGETATITLAFKIGADLVLLDDLAARRVAKDVGLHVSGTLGVLIAAYRKQYINNLESIVDALISMGFRMSEQMVRDVMAQIREV